MLTTAKEGHIYWLPNTSEARSAEFDIGKLNHPVLVLGAERAGSVQALVITSLGSTTLSAKFPERDDRRRKKYLPLNVAGAASHPDNGILLTVRAGRPPILTKPSYVNLEPFEVEVRFLNLDRLSTSFLESDMLELLMEKLLELYPRFVLHRERSAAASSSSQPRGQRSSTRQSRPSPVAQPQPSSPVARSQPPTQQSALLPQRAYSNTSSTTASRRDDRENIGWNATRLPNPVTLPPPPTRQSSLLPQRAYSNTSSTAASRQDYRENIGWNAAQLPNPVTLPPPPTQRSSLLPQRAYSNPYGTTPRQDYRQDPERDAGRLPPYPRPYGAVGDYHDSEGESGYLSGSSLLKYLGIAAGIFISVRYLFR